MKLIFSIFVLVLGCLVLVMACMVAAGRADMKEEYLSIQNWRYCDDDCLNCTLKKTCKVSEAKDENGC